MPALLLGGCSKKTPDDLINEGGNLIRQRDMYGAEIKFQKVLEKAPDSPQALKAHEALGFIYGMSRDFEAARAEFDKVIDGVGGPGTDRGFQAWFAKTRTYIDEGQPQRAIDAILETSPSLKTLSPAFLTMLQLELAGLYLGTDQPQQGLELSRRALNLSTEEPELARRSLTLLTEYYARQNDHAAIVQLHQDFLRRQPDFPHRGASLFQIGHSLSQLGRTEQAQKTFQESIGVIEAQIEQTLGADEKVGLMIQICGIHQQTGDLATARQILQSIIEDFPTASEAPSAMLYLADIHLKTGEPDLAKQLFERLLLQYPNSPRAQQARQFLQQWPQILAARNAATTTATVAPTSRPADQPTTPGSTNQPATPPQAGTP